MFWLNHVQMPDSSSSTSDCVKCGRRVDIPPSTEFATVCGPRCYAPPPEGKIKDLPVAFKDKR